MDAMNDRLIDIQFNESELREEFFRLRGRLLDVIVEFDTIDLRLNPETEARYSALIGVWERGLAKCEIDLRRAKRKYQLAKCAAHHGYQVTEESLDMQIDAELGDSSRFLACAASRNLNAMDACLNAERYTEDMLERLRAMFRHVVDELHPDLNPDVGLLEGQLLDEARVAYARGDMADLCHIDRSIHRGGGVRAYIDSLSIDELTIEHELLHACFVVRSENLAHMRKSFPYIYHDLVRDPNWVCTKANTLRNQIKAVQAQTKEYKRLYQELRG